MQDNAKIKVGISIGDLNGIGCEVILKTFEDPRTLELCTPVVFASSKTLAPSLCIRAWLAPQRL